MLLWMIPNRIDQTKALTGAFWFGQMAQWLRACTTPAKDLYSVPGTHIKPLTTACNPNFRGPDTLFFL